MIFIYVSVIHMVADQIGTVTEKLFNLIAKIQLERNIRKLGRKGEELMDKRRISAILGIMLFLTILSAMATSAQEETQGGINQEFIEKYYLGKVVEIDLGERTYTGIAAECNNGVLSLKWITKDNEEEGYTHIDIDEIKAIWKVIIK